MKSLSIFLYSLLMTCCLFLPTFTTAQNQDGLIALGIVNSDGTVFRSHNTIGGTVTVDNRPDDGYYILTLSATNAFETLEFEDIYILVTSLNNPAATAHASVSSKTDHSVNFQIWTQEVDNAANASGPTPTDAPFSFTVYRTPSMGESRFLTATGTINGDGTSAGGTTVGDYTLSSTKTAANTYQLNLSRPGGIADTPAEDAALYVIQVTSLGAGTDDESFIAYPLPLIGGVKGFQVQVTDQEAGSDPGDSTEEQPFYYTIYRVDFSNPETEARSKLLIALARVDFTADLDSNPNPVTGTNVSVSRDSTGNFFVTVQSAGRFRGYSSTDLSLQLNHNFSNNSDKIIIGTINVIDENQVLIHVTPNDVQSPAGGTGTLSNSGFFLKLLDAKGDLQPDLRIGTSRNLARMKGNNKVNASGNGQQVRLQLKGKRFSKFFFALENDGTLVDRVRLRESGAGGKMKTKFYRLSNGRRNITGQITRSGYSEDELTPGEITRFEGRAKYKRNDRRPRRKIKVKAQSLFRSGEKDTNRVKVTPK